MKRLRVSWRVGAALIVCSVHGSPTAAQVNGPVALSVQVGHDGPITALAIRDDGRIAVTGGTDGALVVWDLETRRELRRFERHSSGIVDVHFVSDAEVVSADRAGLVARWSVLDASPRWLTGPQPRPFEGRFELRITPRRPIRSMTVDPGLGVVAAGREAGLFLIDLQTGAERGPLDPPGAFATPDRDVTAVLSLSSSLLAVADYGPDLRVVDPVDSEIVHELRFHEAPINALVELDGSRLASADSLGRLAVWDHESGELLQSFDLQVRVLDMLPGTTPDEIVLVRVDLLALDLPTGRIDILDRAEESYWSAAGAPGGTVLRGGRGAVRFVDRDGGSREVALESAVRVPLDVSVGAGELLIAAGDTLLRRWPLFGRGSTPALGGGLGVVRSVDISHDGTIGAAGADDGRVLVFDARRRTGSRGWILREDTAAIADVAVDRLTGSDTRVVAVDTAGSLHLVLARMEDDRLSSPLVRSFSAGARLYSVDLDTAGVRLATPDEGVLRTLDLSDGARRDGYRREGSSTSTGVLDAVLTPNGCCVLAGSVYGDVGLYEFEDREEVYSYAVDNSPITALGIASHGDWFVSGNEDGVVRRWKTDDDEAPLWSRPVHGAVVTATEPTSDDRHVITASADGTMAVLSADTGERIATLVVGRSTTGDRWTWTVVAPDGRFDTNAFEAEHGLQWVAGDQPSRALALETFTRDYFEPYLLRKLLEGEPLGPVPDVSTLDRSVPTIEIVSVEPDPDAPGRRRVRLRATPPRPGEPVHDLRLLRDGRLVAQWPEPVATADDGLVGWRERTGLPVDADGVVEREITIPVPLTSSGVELSAYAFNRDRVKSSSATRTLRLLGRAAAPRRAVVVTIGVGDNQDRNRRLTFAAHDAHAVGDSLQRALASAGGYDDVVTVGLFSAPPDRGLSYLELPDAPAPDAANIRGVFSALAGEELPPALAGLDVPQVGPDDDLIIYVASHGVQTDDGSFVLLPRDIGPGNGEELTPGQVENGISSAELAEWLRPIDAHSITIILSTCYATSAVQDGTFRPGPLGDPGFGQLAYDKGMRVMAASQSDAMAGGLTYLGRALVEHGLRWIRENGQTRLVDLLRFAVRRVPELSTDTEQLQTPQLFDWSRGERDVVIAN